MIDPNSPVPLYQQIAGTIRWQLATGKLAPGAALPPTREAAGKWGVNRHTVRRAYQELAAAGLIEGRPPRRMIVAESADHAAGEARLSEFIARMLREAERDHGLPPQALLRRLFAHLGAEGVAGARATVVECSDSQCVDLKEELERFWTVSASTVVIGSGGEPPPGPIIATLHHYEELRRAWPRRLGETRFVATMLDPALAGFVERSGEEQGTRRVVILAQEDRVGAANLVNDLSAIVPEGKYDVSAIILPDLTPAFWRKPQVVLATPHAWDDLPSSDRERPAVARIRYVFDPYDLELVGRAFGWVRRVSRSAGAVIRPREARHG